MANRTFYEILQVARDASPEIIAAARRTLMATLRKHPDRGGSDVEAALINEACDALLDPVRRAAYDASLRQSGGAAPSGPRRMERRRFPRRPVDAVVAFCFDHDLRWHSARVKDLSPLGIRFITRTPLATGQHLVIAPSNLAAAAFHGTVRWTRMFHPSVFERVYEAGIEFNDQISDVEQRIAV